MRAVDALPEKESAGDAVVVRIVVHVTHQCGGGQEHRCRQDFEQLPPGTPCIDHHRQDDGCIAGERRGKRRIAVGAVGVRVGEQDVQGDAARTESVQFVEYPRVGGAWPWPAADGIDAALVDGHDHRRGASVDPHGAQQRVIGGGVEAGGGTGLHEQVRPDCECEGNEPALDGGPREQGADARAPTCLHAPRVVNCRAGRR